MKSRWLIALVSLTIGLVLVVRSRITQVDASLSLLPLTQPRPNHLPQLDPIDLPAAEFEKLAATLRRTEQWFHSLSFAHLQHRTTVTKSDDRYQQDLAEMRAQFPDREIVEADFPWLAQVWDLQRSVAFTDDRFAWEEHRGDKQQHAEKWDGQLLTGFVDPSEKQQPNYYLKSKATDLMSPLCWFPRIGKLAFWFGDETALPGHETFSQQPPVLAGSLIHAGRRCIVLRGAAHHWIVSRADGRVYGKYNRHEFEEFSDHREVAAGIYWPMSSVRRRYDNSGLQWTDATTVTLIAVDRPPAASLLTLEMKSGIKVHDLRTEHPVVYVHDPNRTAQQWAEIRSTAAQKAESHNAAKREADALLGKPAPELGDGRWLNGEPLSIAQFKGKKTVLLGFGHTACGPCGSMLAMFSGRQNDTSEQLILVFAATDAVDAVKQKLEVFGLQCPTFIPASDDEASFGKPFSDYRVQGYPTLVSIDALGIIESHNVGILGGNERNR